jgi:hypothetical protein
LPRAELGRIAAVAALALPLAACGGGGSGSSGSSGGGGGDGSLVGDVGHVDVKLEGKTVVATAKIKVGGVPGKHVTLTYNVVDAVAGRVSQEDRVVKRYTTTNKVVSDDVTVRFPRPAVATTYLVHFAMAAPGVGYIDSADTDEFEVPNG